MRLLVPRIQGAYLTMDALAVRLAVPHRACWRLSLPSKRSMPGAHRQRRADQLTCPPERRLPILPAEASARNYDPYTLGAGGGELLQNSALQDTSRIAS